MRMARASAARSTCCWSVTLAQVRLSSVIEQALHITVTAMNLSLSWYTVPV